MSYQTLSYFSSENGNDPQLQNFKQATDYSGPSWSVGTPSREPWVALDSGAAYERNMNGPSSSGPSWGPKNAVVSPVTSKKMKSKYKSSSSSSSTWMIIAIVVVVILAILFMMHHQKKKAAASFYF